MPINLIICSVTYSKMKKMIIGLKYELIKAEVF